MAVAHLGEALGEDPPLTLEQVRKLRSMLKP
jgi:hypothetical protein